MNVVIKDPINNGKHLMNKEPIFLIGNSNLITDSDFIIGTSKNSNSTHE